MLNNTDNKDEITYRFAVEGGFENTSEEDKIKSIIVKTKNNK